MPGGWEPAGMANMLLVNKDTLTPPHASTAHVPPHVPKQITFSYGIMKP